MSSSSVPSPRSGHFSAGRNRSTFYWGGATWDEVTEIFIPVTDLEYLYELEVVTDKWKKHLLKGQHPPGVSHGACAVVGSCLYLYGGRDKEGEHTGSLFELNLINKSWRELSGPETGGPKKKSLCGMVAYNSTLIIHGGRTRNGYTNELHKFDIEEGIWSSPHVSGDAPPLTVGFIFTKVSNHQVVLHGGAWNKDTYVLDLFRMHWEKSHHSAPEEVTRSEHVAACLGLGDDHAQLFMLSMLGYLWLLDVATWKWMKIKLPDDVVITPGSSATAIQTSPTSVEVVVYGDELLQFKFRKQPSAPEGVLPVQWWILTEYVPDRKMEVGGVRLFKPRDPQTSSNISGNARDDDEDGQAVSANVSTSSSGVQSEKTFTETDEVAAQSENVVFSTNFTAEELADWLHSHHKLPEGACKIIKDQSIIGSVFVKLTKETIDSLRFNFGACQILLEVLNQIKEHQPAQVSDAGAPPGSQAGAKFVGGQKPDVGEASKALHKAQNKWEQIGLELGVDADELESIDDTFRKNDKKLLEMLKKWLAADKNTTWNALVQALRSNTVGRNDIANEIEKNTVRL